MHLIRRHVGSGWDSAPSWWLIAKTLRKHVRTFDLPFTFHLPINSESTERSIVIVMSSCGPNSIRLKNLNYSNRSKLLLPLQGSFPSAIDGSHSRPRSHKKTGTTMVIYSRRDARLRLISFSRTAVSQYAFASKICNPSVPSPCVPTGPTRKHQQSRSTYCLPIQGLLQPERSLDFQD